MSKACRKATELISKGMDRPLMLRERLALGIHLAVCRGCWRFRRQVERLRRIARDAASMIARPSSAPAPELSAQARARIEAVARRLP